MSVIRTATDLRRLGASAPAITRSPDKFDGTLEELTELHILRTLPSPESVYAFHRALSDYTKRPDAVFLVRGVSGTERGQIYTTVDGSRFKATDNAPAWWIHAALVQNHSIEPNTFAEVMGTLPTHLFEVARTCAATANQAGWHIAHIFNVKNGDTDYVRWRRTAVIARSVLSLHPCNYFVLPKMDWAHWGGDERVIGYFASIYAHRYRDVWAEFLKLAAADESSLARVTGSIPYTYGATTEKRRKLATSRQPAALAQRVAVDRDSSPVQEYRASRLTFKRDVIEALAPDDAFRVITPIGVFEMTKAAFYSVFPNVPLTSSYRESGAYNYATLPKAAEQFRLAIG